MLPVGLKHNDWILVGDGEKALFLRNAGDAEQASLETLDVRKHANPSTHEQGTDKPGRMPDTGHGQRSSVEQTDWHELEKQRFADEIAEILYKAAHAGEYQRLIIVTPPKVLGELRRVLHDEVERRVVATVDKTLTNHPVGKIQEVLLGR